MRQVRIVHETNPRKYFPAIYKLEERNRLRISGEHRYSVLKEWLRSGIKDRTPLSTRTRNALGDLGFRVIIPWLKGETIVLGFAPFDWRILILRSLAKRNRIIYHTSWHDWRLERVPRQPKTSVFRSILVKAWLEFLRNPSVDIVAVTPTVAKSLKEEMGLHATVIPHAVSEEFYSVAQKRNANESALKLLFVGEVSEKKGVPQILSMMNELGPLGASLTVVGSGALSEELEHNKANWLSVTGPISSRKELASIMGQHDVLLVMSQKTNSWEELFGIVIIEAIASGVAVVASDHIGPRGILEDAGSAGLFPEDDLEGVIDLLKEMLYDRRSIGALYQRQEVVRDRYKLEEISKDWARVLGCRRSSL